MQGEGREDGGQAPLMGRRERSSESSPIIKFIKVVFGNHARTGQHADRDGQVERRAFLADVGRGEDDDGFETRQAQAGVFERGLHARLAVVHGAVGQADDESPRLYFNF